MRIFSWQFRLLFGRNRTAHRFCPWKGKLHVPEVRFGREELHSQILLAVARPVDGDNPALHRLRSMIVHQDERLSHQHNFFEMKQGAVPVYRLRMGLDTNFSPASVFPRTVSGTVNATR